MQTGVAPRGPQLPHLGHLTSGWDPSRNQKGEVENECTSYNFRQFAIIVPKIVSFGGSLYWWYDMIR